MNLKVSTTDNKETETIDGFANTPSEENKSAGSGKNDAQSGEVDRTLKIEAELRITEFSDMQKHGTEKEHINLTINDSDSDEENHAFESITPSFPKKMQSADSKVESFKSKKRKKHKVKVNKMPEESENIEAQNTDRN